MPPTRLRLFAGWTAVTLAGIIVSFWAFWGTAETFHEGWYFRSVWRNLGLTFVQYLGPALLCLIPVAAALRWRRTALPLFAVLGIAAGWFFHGSTGTLFLAVPLALLGILFHFGRPEPRRWAWRVVLGLPLLTAICTGIVPGYRAVTRFDDGNYGARLVEGNGVRLIWAPQGPGWPARFAGQDEATETCAHLTADGRTLSPAPVGIWRLPTAEEAVRSLVRHGRNAGGTWDPARLHASYRTLPEKESPLWNRYSPIIYWWTATQDSRGYRLRVSYNGFVLPSAKGWGGGAVSFRCVSAPPASLDAAVR